jgi:hypothetical protein
MELWGKEGAFRGAVCPAFFSGSGEPLPVPKDFQDAVTRISVAAYCVDCRHCHLLQPNYHRSNNRKLLDKPGKSIAILLYLDLLAKSNHFRAFF